jgi:hypothetical protein
MASIIEVWIRPGATALTRMFIGPSSLAAENVAPMTAAFVAE